ncbi:MAG: sporulation protein YhbH [Bacteroidales bacterium]
MNGGLGMEVVSQQDWSLYRKGEADQRRHKEKLENVLRKRIQDIVADESIIMSDGKKTVKIPIRGLNQYRFKFNSDDEPGAGTGRGGSKKGDIIYQKSKDGKSGDGKGAGDMEGEEYYEAEVSIEDIQEILFKDLGLPYLHATKHPDLTVEKITFNNVRKNGLMSNVDKRRTIKNAMRRNAMRGIVGIKPMKPEDLRYKTWTKKFVPKSNAVIFAMMDVSGSMGTFEKYIARSFFFWMTRFLQTKYSNVEVVFIAHHTTAKVVGEEQFFSRGESGGTLCSSAYDLAIELIEKHYPIEDYNLYAFHFSDGDNWSHDNPKALKLMRKLCSLCNAVGYGEIKGQWVGSFTTLYQLFTDETALRPLKNFAQVLIANKSGVYSALKQFFRPSWDTDKEVFKAWVTVEKDTQTRIEELRIIKPVKFLFDSKLFHSMFRNLESLKF